MKKIFIMFCMVGMALSLMAGCSGSARTERQNENTGDGSSEVLENGVGISSEISIEDAYYYNLLANDAGDIFAFTDNFSEEGSKDAPVIVWKSSDRGHTWEEALHQPEALQDGFELHTGAMRLEKDGLEAYAVFSEHADETIDGSANRLYRITENTCEELQAEEVFEQLGDGVWNISFVNEHIISLAGGEQCILYDTDRQKMVKSLSYDSYAVGFLSMPKQFLVYGKEVAYCLNADTLEEQEADESLQEFVATMYEKNGNTVFPPMNVYKDAIICVTAEAVYEYREGKTVQTLSVPDMLNGGNCFNGMYPICKGKDNTYYMSGYAAKETRLWRLEADKETDKDVFSIYSLTKNASISQIAMLFQQEHPELKVELRVGMEDEAALTRTDAIKQLNTELMAGGGADIIIMDGLSVEKYADMGLLQPIRLEQPEEKYFKNIVETYHKDGTLYAVPIGFWLHAIQGPTDMPSEITSPTELCQWIFSNADKAGLDGYEYTAEYNAYSQYTQFIYDAYADSIAQNGAADTKALEAYMDICGKLAEKSAQGLSEENYFTNSILPGAVEIHYNDKVKVSAGMVLDAMDLAALIEEQKNEEAEYSLYPMYQPCNILAVNANTAHADMARKFVGFSLGDSAQKMSVSYFHPVALERFRSTAQGEGMDVDPDGLVAEISLEGEKESFMIYRPTDDEIDSLEQEIKEIDNVFTDDVIMRNIVMEALQSYLSGSATLQDAVSSAENRINLYLGE